MWNFITSIKLKVWGIIAACLAIIAIYFKWKWAVQAAARIEIKLEIAQAKIASNKELIDNVKRAKNIEDNINNSDISNPDLMQKLERWRRDTE